MQYREKTVTLVCRTTKLVTEVSHCCVYRQIPVMNAVFWWTYTWLVTLRWTLITCFLSISTYGLSLAGWFGQPLGTLLDTSLVGIDGNSNSDMYFSEILCSVVMPCLRDLPSAIFRQNNTCWASCSDIPHYLGYLITVLAWTVSRSITGWKHQLMDPWETGPSYLPS